MRPNKGVVQTNVSCAGQWVEIEVMAILRKPVTKRHMTLTPEQELAYAICGAFYMGGCACMKGDHGSVCMHARHAADAAKRVLARVDMRQEER